MAAWPATLPQCQSQYSEKRQDGALRSDMDTGPAKVRRRFTATSTYLQLTYLLTLSQSTELDTFYDVTTNKGSDVFDFLHPRLGTTVRARFMEPPELAADRLLWRARVQLEVLP